MQRRLRLVALALAGSTVVVSLACGKSGGEIVQPRTTTTAPSLTPLTCQAACAARPAEGREALKRADVNAAFDAYRCGDTPEAAFGAGLTTLLAAIEGESMTKVLADLGQGSVKAADVIGSNGWLSRYGKRYPGVTGTVTRTDAAGVVLDTIPLARGGQIARPASNSNYTSARFYAINPLAKVSVSWSGPVTAGQRLGCGSSGYPTVSYSTPTVSCSSNSSATNCASAGAIVVTKPGTAAGDTVEYTLDNVLVTCNPRGTASTTTGGTPARLSGTLSTVVAPEKVDLTGLSPIFTETADFPAKLVPGVTVEKILASAAGLAGSLELASCYFNAAGTGSGDGKVFDIPGEVYGGPGLAVSRGDAKIFSALAALSSSAIVLAEAYRLPLELKGLVCSGGTNSAAPCIPNEEAARRINAGIGGIADREKIEIARRLFGSALSAMGGAAGGLGPSSIFAKEGGASAESFDKLQALVDALRQSLDTGTAILPHISPEFKVDLKSIFDNPPDPDKLSVDPVVYKPETKRIEIVEAFFDQAMPSTKVPWSSTNQRYTFDNGKELSLTSMSYRLESNFPF